MVVDPEESSSNPDVLNDLHKTPQSTVRQVRLILDHSAFVRGIGNVKRWFNQEYITSNITRSNETIHLNIFIPSYTLHEFDFVKRGTSISATNAREAIRFIDNYFETEQDREIFKEITYDLSLESSTDAIPNWNTCHRYKIHSPQIKEFPNYKTKFDSNFIGQGKPQQYYYGNNFEEALSGNFDNSVSLDDDSESLAQMPARLRYLIRTCIYKRFIEHHECNNETEEWKLVSEDPIAKIWAKCYGIDVVNVNEAELLIFQSYDVNSFRLDNPHNNFSIEEEFDPRTNILQNTIDTTLYSYTTVEEDQTNFNKQGSRSRKGRNKNTTIPTKLAVQGVRQDPDGRLVKREKFQAINYAPRGSGDLWEP
ncbi:Nonsense-mediated decay protein 4 [Spathaspora sp. JA1]|nr:Nonsense-mediated decay protein 4 [Spathaspora sp. JA1]